MVAKICKILNFSMTLNMELFTIVSLQGKILPTYTHSNLSETILIMLTTESEVLALNHLVIVIHPNY